MHRFDHLFFGPRPLRQQIDPDEDITVTLTAICIGIFLLLLASGLFWLTLRIIFKVLGREIASS